LRRISSTAVCGKADTGIKECLQISRLQRNQAGHRAGIRMGHTGEVWSEGKRCLYHKCLINITVNSLLFSFAPQLFYEINE